jgi:glutamate-1-semialdehyde 2,1-aminomutase
MKGFHPFVESLELERRAEGYFPGGVNSPVRAFRAVGGHPPFVVRAEGTYLYDADGNRYLDFFGSWGPMILGHAFPPVVEAIREAAGRGASFGASHAGEANLAELVRYCFPSVEKMRFVSSGTEACMSALPFNDLAAVEAVFAARPEEIACVIVEPVVGNAGTIPPAAGYLEGLRRLCTEYGALLILDEVMTGFRLSLGGAQRLFGVTPDLTTLGKIVGGGLPCGVFGGRAEIMDHLAPLGPVYQAGTLSGNPLAMAAGIATLRGILERGQELYAGLDRTTAAIADGVAKVAAEMGIAMTTNRVGSMFTWFFTPHAVRDFASAATSDTALFGRFHRGMLERGVWLPPSQYEAAFVSAAHGEAEVEMVLEAARVALRG